MHKRFVVRLAAGRQQWAAHAASHVPRQPVPQPASHGSPRIRRQDVRAAAARLFWGEWGNSICQSIKGPVYHSASWSNQYVVWLVWACVLPSSRYRLQWPSWSPSWPWRLEFGVWKCKSTGQLYAIWSPPGDHELETKPALVCSVIYVRDGHWDFPIHQSTLQCVIISCSQSRHQSIIKAIRQSINQTLLSYSK